MSLYLIIRNVLAWWCQDAYSWTHWQLINMIKPDLYPITPCLGLSVLLLSTFLGLVLLINLHLLPASVSKNRFLLVSSAINSLVSSDGSVTYSLRNRTVLTPSDGFATLTWSLEFPHPHPWGTKLLDRLVSKSRPSSTKRSRVRSGYIQVNTLIIRVHYTYDTYTIRYDPDAPPYAYVIIIFTDLAYLIISVQP